MDTKFIPMNDEKHCEYCNKSYKSASGLEKHRYLCKFMTDIYCENIYASDDIPSHKALYFMLLELGKKNKILEDKVNDLQKYGNVTRKKKKEIGEFLTGKPPPTPTNLDDTCYIKFFDHHFSPSPSDVENYLFEHKCTDFFNYMLKKIDFTNAPIFSAECHKNLFFAFINDTWTELHKEDIFKILFRCIKIIFSPALQLKKDNTELIYKCNKTEKKFDSLMVKLLDIDLHHEPTFIKYRNILFDNLKISID